MAIVFEVWGFLVFGSRFGSTRFDSVKLSQLGSTNGQLGQRSVNRRPVTYRNELSYESISD
ncbi:hypothetical protein Hanom_Chr12g01137241 [Helianthus anomalus]